MSGRTFDEAAGRAWAAAVHPGDIDGLTAEWRRVCEHTRVYA